MLRNSYRGRLLKSDMDDKFVTVRNFPSYMVCYAYYGDECRDDLTDEDIAEYNKWLERNGLCRMVGLADDDEEPSFSSHPAFGLACDTITVVFEKDTDYLDESRKMSKVRRLRKSSFIMNDLNRDIKKMEEYRAKGSSPRALANTVRTLEKCLNRWAIATCMGWEEASEAFYRRGWQLGATDEDFEEALAMVEDRL